MYSQNICVKAFIEVRMDDLLQNQTASQTRGHMMFKPVRVGVIIKKNYETNNNEQKGTSFLQVNNFQIENI